jgi:acyl dehydratase
MTPLAPCSSKTSVGRRIPQWRAQLDEDQIVAFARQFDPQPFHTDGEAARQTFFQGLAASGWHTAAVTMKLLVQSVPLGGGLIGAGARWNGRGPPGRAMCCAWCRVLEIRPRAPSRTAAW